MSNDLVTLTTTQTEFEANILAIVLRDNGIDAYVFASSAVGIGIPLSHGVHGVPLQVKQADLELARRTLIENRRHSIDIDWDELELVGSDDDHYEASGMSITATIAFFCAMMAALAGLTFVILQLIN